MERTETYKQTPQGEMRMHLHLPADWKAEDRRPGMVFFFGSGWRKGTVEQLRTEAEYFAGRGIVTARADYRVLDPHGVAPDKCVEDARSAARWLKQNAARLGIDPDRIICAGASAGGHIAACCCIEDAPDAETDDPAVSPLPCALVLYNPATDMTGEELVDRIGSMELTRRISPVHNISSGMPPAVLFYGSDDALIEQGRAFCPRYAEHGNEVELYIADGVGHGFFNHAPWRQHTLLAADRFLLKHGLLTGEPSAQPSPEVSLRKG